MKRLYILLFALFVICGAMAQWVPLNSGTTNNLNSLYFVDANTGYAVGDSGAIVKTADGGMNWESKNSGTTQFLRSVHFPANDIGYIVSDALILKTTDEGDSWNQQSEMPVYNFGKSVYFTDAETGFIVGEHDDGDPPVYGFIMKTVDGGSTWSNPNESMSQYAVHFPDPNTGYSVGFGGILKTTDAGLTWILNLSLEPSGETFTSVYFTDVLNGHAVTDLGTIYRTTDGGATWTTQAKGIYLSSVYFPDPGIGYIVGKSGLILNTIDGGTTWTNQNSATDKNLSSVFFTDTNTGYVVGDSGIILKTTNGGGPVGINEQQRIPDIKMCPNPAANKITISYPKGVTMEDVIIYNQTGQKILQGKPVNNKLDISKLQPGMYIIELVSNQGKMREKLIVE